MIPSRRSFATKSNPDLEQASLREGERRPPLSQCIREAVGDKGEVAGTILLLGGTDLTHFRLRIAQSHVRSDSTPSYWSHIGIVLPHSKNKLLLVEVPLDPSRGFSRMPETNGIQKHRLYPDHDYEYDNTTRFPNVAVVWFPIRPEPDLTRDDTVKKAIGRIQAERGLLDLTALILPWLGFVWGAGTPGNPLLAGNGIPSAAFVEAVFASMGMELTPGLESRASCPEAIWQAAKWWHSHYETITPAAPSEKAGEQATKASHENCPRGKYWLGQPQAAIVE